jgi:hypothetical protein
MTQRVAPICRARTTRGRDDGFALPLVLVFVVVIGALVAVLLGQSETNFHSVVTTRAVQSRIDVANAAIDTGIQRLRAGRAIDGSVVCSSPTGGPVALGTVEIAARSASVTCDVQSGQLAGADGWAVFITDPAGHLTIGGGGTKQIEGPVYHAGGAGGFDAPAGEQLAVVGGDVVLVDGAGSCTAPPAAVMIGPAPLYTTACIGAPVAIPSPSQPLPAVALAAAPPQPADGDAATGSCRTFTPGRYVDAPQLGAGGNYLRSGLYFLDDVGTWTIDADLVGGIAAPAESPVTGLAACPPVPETAAGTGGHDGVLLVLGGNSRVVLADHARVELFGYVDPARPAAAGTSVRQVRASDLGWEAKASTVSGPTDDLVAVSSGAGAVAVHGTVFAPGARVHIGGVSGAVTTLGGGVVAAGLDLTATGGTSGGAPVVSTRVAPGQRDVVLVATADQLTGEKAITATARVTIDNGPGRASLVQSWIVSNP